MSTRVRQVDPHRCRRPSQHAGIPSVRLRDGLHDRKAESNAGTGAGAISPRESFKGSLGELGRKPGALVSHVDSNSVGTSPGMQLDCAVTVA